MYTPELLEDVLVWCVESGVHLICDEVSPNLLARVQPHAAL